MANAPRRIVFSVPALVPDHSRPAADGAEAAEADGPAPAAHEASDARKLATVMEVGEALAGTLNLQAGLYAALEVLERRCGATRGMVALIEEESGLLAVQASLTDPGAAGRDRYRVKEGPAGQAVRSGSPVVIPRASEQGGDVALLCVPIQLDGTPVGALQVELRHDAERGLERMVKVLRIAAGMISQSLRIQRLIGQERARLVEENTQLREELRERYEFTNLIGNSGAMRRVYEQITQVVGTGATVLIRGESGTGKELIAHALHHHSPRAGGPFVRVNCAALPETLVESELFGYERGAFTGAQARRKGRFELADGGTLFLDEIGELSPSTQAKLLRALQEREFERLGGSETVRVDVRLIAATNKDLEQALADGAFREDLYYRLNVFAICVPPLRERKPDILLLADHFVEKYARLHQRSIRRISTPAIDMLMSYHWPGNVRELENAIERAVLVAEGDVIHGHHLSPILQTAEASGTVISASLSEAVRAFESNLIQDALKTSRGNRARAARLLGSTERIIGYKIRQYGIDPARFKH